MALFLQRYDELDVFPEADWDVVASVRPEGWPLKSDRKLFSERGGSDDSAMDPLVCNIFLEFLCLHNFNVVFFIN